MKSSHLWPGDCGCKSMQSKSLPVSLSTWLTTLCCTRESFQCLPETQDKSSKNIQVKQKKIPVIHRDSVTPKLFSSMAQPKHPPHSRRPITTPQEVKQVCGAAVLAGTEWAPGGAFPAVPMDQQWPIHTPGLEPTPTYSSHVRRAFWVGSWRT